MKNLLNYQKFNEGMNVNQMSDYDQDLDNRLKKYLVANPKEPSFEWWKDYFQTKANPYNMKNSSEAFLIYTRLMNDFLEGQGF